MAETFLVLAQAGGGAAGNLLLIGGLFAIMYFLVIRPQQKQVKEHKNLLAALKKGDDVVTQGGLLGKIYAVTDKIITLEIASGVRVRVLKTAIQGRSTLGEEATVPAKAEEKKEEK